MIQLAGYPQSDFMFELSSKARCAEVHTDNPRYLGVGDKRITVQGQPRQKKS
jgi:hypothetical protein